MNFSGNIFLIAIVVASLLIVIGLSRAIIRNSHTGMLHRDKLLERIKSLRLHKMLAAIGIDDRKYLYKANLADIETHMQRCEQCDARQECDEDLEQGMAKNADAYCPNNEDLVKINQS